MGVFPFDLDPATLAKMADEIMARLTALGLSRRDSADRVNLLCRRVIAGASRVVGQSDPKWSDIVQANKDLQEIWFLIRVFGDRLTRGELQRRFKVILNDPLHPPTNTPNAKGRDAQFELLVGAALERAGLKPLMNPSGPDWLIELPRGSRCSVEAKRPRSHETLETCASEAADQVKSSGMAGILVFDISVAVGADQHRLSEFRRQAEVDEANRKQSEDFRKRFLPLIEKVLKHSNIGLLVVHDYVIRPAAIGPTGEIPWSLLSYWTRFYFRASTDGSYALFKEVSDLMLQGLPFFGRRGED